MNSKSVHAVRRVELPRPLKLNRDSSEKHLTVVIDSTLMKKPLTDIWKELQFLFVNLSECNYDENTATVISKLCNILKSRGADLDQTDKNLMDNYFVTFRNTSREDRLDMISRLKLLEVIEMRAMKWQTNENIVAYYKRKITEFEGTDKVPVLLSPSIAHSYSSLMPCQTPQVPTTTVSVPLAPGEILRSSGKFAKPTKIAGKNYYKDEVVIRNSDSGKVMGIKGRRVHMIEELSDTIISFQRVNPGARDRLVQITGPNEESISHAKTLVEDTIRRNASPMREKTDSLSIDINDSSRMIASMGFDEAQEFSSRKQQLAHSFSMGDASLSEYSYKVNIGNDSITLSGGNAELLKVARIALQTYFAGQMEIDEKEKHFAPVTNERNSNVLTNSVMKHRLQRSLSWMDSSGRASLSPDSSSEDDVFKDFIMKTSPPNRDESPLYSRKSSQNSDNNNTELLSPLEVNSNFMPFVDRLPFPSPTLEPDAVPSIPPPAPRKYAYTSKELHKYSRSPLCKTTAIKLNEEVIENYPFVLRSSAFQRDEMMYTSIIGQ